MKAKNRFTEQSCIMKLAGMFLLLAAMLLTDNTSAFAAITSGNATIYNTVSVTYSSGSTSTTVKASVSVTVATIAALPAITVPTGKSVLNGAFVSYSTSLKSNANGIDTYNLTQATAASGIDDPTPTYSYNPATSVQLWGGITVANASGVTNHIYLPGGSAAGLEDDTSILVIGSKRYLVTNIVPGSEESGTFNADGTVLDAHANEVKADLTLLPLDGTDITTWAGGEQVGELKKIGYTFYAPAPTAAGTDGTYTYTIKVETTATQKLPATTTLTSTIDPTTTIITKVQSPKLLITKQYKVVASGAAVASPIVPSSYGTSMGSAKPGEVIEYLITIKNSAVVGSPGRNVTVTDATPAYTTYVADSAYSGIETTTLTNITGGNPFAAGRDIGNLPGGNTGANDPVGTAYVVFQVKVDQ